MEEKKKNGLTQFIIFGGEVKGGGEAGEREKERKRKGGKKETLPNGLSFFS